MMDASTVPLINEDKMNSFDPSKTVIYKLEHTVNTDQRIAELERLLDLNAHPQNRQNIRVALQAYRDGALPRSDTTYVFVQFGVIIPHNQINRIDPSKPGERYDASARISRFDLTSSHPGVSHSNDVPRSTRFTAPSAAVTCRKIWLVLCGSKWARGKRSRY